MGRGTVECVRSVGDKVTAEVIRRYFKHQHENQLGFDF